MKTHTIRLIDIATTGFAADGNQSHSLFWSTIKPMMEADPELALVIDCEGIDNMTDSFSNALFCPCWRLVRAGRNIKVVNTTPLIKSFVSTAVQMHENNLKKQI